MECSTSGLPVHHQLLEFLRLMSIELVMPSNHLILFLPLLLPPSIFPSISVFSSESALRIRWPKDWSFSFSISPSSEYSGLISFRMDCFDLLAVQGTLESLLQYHSLKASILWCSAFLMVQLSHPYVTTGKTIALTIWTFVSKVMSLCLNTLSRFVLAFLPRSKHLLISWWTPHLLEFAQVYVHWIGDTIQPSHPLSSPFPPALNLSQHQDFFPMSQLSTSGGQNIGASALASVLPMNVQS